MLDGLALGLSQTPPFPRHDGGENSASASAGVARNRMEWGLLLLGVPTLAMLALLIWGGAGLGDALAIVMCIGLMGTLYASSRLRSVGLPAPPWDLAALIWSQSFVALLALCLFCSLAGAALPFMEPRWWLSGTFRLSLAVVVTALSAWLVFPADRVALQRRSACVWVAVLCLSLHPDNSHNVVMTTLHAMADGRSEGILVSRDGTPLPVPPDLCADMACVASKPIRAVGNLGHTVVYWSYEDTVSGRRFRQAEVLASEARFEVQRHEPWQGRDFDLFY